VKRQTLEWFGGKRSLAGGFIPAKALVMVKLIVVLGLLFSWTPTMASEPPYVWSTWSKQVAFFGVPETDDGSLMVLCDEAEGLMIAGWIGQDAPVGSRVPIAFRGAGFSVRRTAVVSECDGLCFSTPVKPDDPAVRTLLAGKILTIEQAGEIWTVSGKGAAQVLRPLIKACRASTSRN